MVSEKAKLSESYYLLPKLTSKMSGTPVRHGHRLKLPANSSSDNSPLSKLMESSILNQLPSSDSLERNTASTQKMLPLAGKLTHSLTPSMTSPLLLLNSFGKKMRRSRRRPETPSLRPLFPNGSLSLTRELLPTRANIT